MESPATGAIVLIPFPFSGLSQAKLRPEVLGEISDRVIELLKPPAA